MHMYVYVYTYILSFSNIFLSLDLSQWSNENLHWSTHISFHGGFLAGSMQICIGIFCPPLGNGACFDRTQETVKFLRRSACSRDKAITRYGNRRIALYLIHAGCEILLFRFDGSVPFRNLLFSAAEETSFSRILDSYGEARGFLGFP